MLVPDICQLTCLSPTVCSAYSVPVDPKSPCKGDLCSRHLNDAQLGHWFGKNMLPGYGPKTTPLPVGLASEQKPYGNSRMLLEVAQSAPAWEDRATSVYVAVSLKTHSNRTKVVQQMSSLPGALSVTKRINYSTYLKHLANSKFVAAPRGTGIDTYRAWEVSKAYGSLSSPSSLVFNTCRTGPVPPESFSMS